MVFSRISLPLLAAPWGLLGAILLIGIVERELGRQEIHATTIAQENCKFVDRMSRRAASYDLLCLGDSQAKYGIAPPVLEAELGRRTLNLAVAGGTPPQNYFILRRALAQGARPAALLLNYKPSNLQYNLLAEMNLAVRNNSVLLSLGECAELAYSVRSLEFLTWVAIAKAMPSVRDRDWIRICVANRTKGICVDSKEIVGPQIRDWNQNGGGGILARRPTSGTEERFWDEGACTISTWWCDQVGGQYLRRTLKLTESRGIAVFWVVMPIHPRLQQYRDAHDLDAPYTRFLRSALRQHPNLVVVDARSARYPHYVFDDATHLNRDGAYVLSCELAALLRAGLPPDAETAPARWLDLPAYRDRPMTLHPRDQMASKRVVSGRTSVR